MIKGPFVTNRVCVGLGDEVDGMHPKLCVITLADGKPRFAGNHWQRAHELRSRREKAASSFSQSLLWRLACGRSNENALVLPC